MPNKTRNNESVEEGRIVTQQGGRRGGGVGGEG